MVSWAVSIVGTTGGQEGAGGESKGCGHGEEWGQGHGRALPGEKVWGGRRKRGRYPAPCFGDREMRKLSQRQWPENWSKIQRNPLRLVCYRIPNPRYPEHGEEGLGARGQHEA